MRIYKLGLLGADKPNLAIYISHHGDIDVMAHGATAPRRRQIIQARLRNGKLRRSDSITDNVNRIYSVGYFSIRNYIGWELSMTIFNDASGRQNIA